MKMGLEGFWRAPNQKLSFWLFILLEKLIINIDVLGGLIQ
tara:strand:+ start:503 stop:622 length:120 start_codon:yes stop_codon:yes gene_type:complete